MGELQENNNNKMHSGTRLSKLLGVAVANVNGNMFSATKPGSGEVFSKSVVISRLPPQPTHVWHSGGASRQHGVGGFGGCQVCTQRPTLEKGHWSVIDFHQINIAFHCDYGRVIMIFYCQCFEYCFMFVLKTKELVSMLLIIDVK